MIKVTNIDNSVESELWHLSLPHIIDPYKGESLYGYLLRLDIANNFPIGSVLRLINRHNNGSKSLNRPGLFLCGTIFNMIKLSRLTSIPYEKILELTLINPIKRIFAITSPYPELVGYSANFKVCPLCVKAYKLPIIHAFKNIDVCIEHELQLLNKCSCGHKIMLFQQNTGLLVCPKCDITYSSLDYNCIDKSAPNHEKQVYLYNAYTSILHENVNFVSENESVIKGFEDRLQYIIRTLNIGHGKFKEQFGYDASNLKNGHGLDNLSLSKILDMLYELGYSPKTFSEIKIDSSVSKTINITPCINENINSHTCPNVYCKYFNKTNLGNIRYYGRRVTRSGRTIIEEYCTICATRFIENNIIQSYDYNPGVRQYEIDKAVERIAKWQDTLTNICKKKIIDRIPITLTGCFKDAGIPIGKTYFTERLGLVKILEEFANIQRSDLIKWSHEMDLKEIKSFERRIFKRSKNG